VICQLTEQVDAWVLLVPGSRGSPRVSAGRDHVDLAAAKASGVSVINTADVLTDASADRTMALIGGVVRRVAEDETAVRTGAFGGWRRLPEPLGDRRHIA
jgi:lactate dehydrogenase-like 2-hydroxyacid dehydrogenase